MGENEEKKFIPFPSEEILTPVFQNDQKYTDTTFIKALALSYQTTPDQIRIERFGNLKMYYFGELPIFKEYV